MRTIILNSAIVGYFLSCSILHAADTEGIPPQSDDSISAILESESESDDSEHKNIVEEDSATNSTNTGDEIENHPFDHNCRLNDGNPMRCNQTNGCTYDYRTNICLGFYNPNPNPLNFCSRFNFNYNLCVRSGCQYEPSSGICIGAINPIPNPQPFFCARFNFNQFGCQRSGCVYEWRTGQCYGGGGYNPPYRRNYVCTADDDGWEEHFGGHEGFGFNHVDAQRAAIFTCQRFHGRCHINNCRLQ